MELQVYKLRQVDIDKLREKNKTLEEQNIKLKNQNEILIVDQGKLKEYEKMKNYFMEETQKEKTEHKMSQLVLKKQKSQFEQQEIVIGEMQRKLDTANTKNRGLERELHEKSAKLSVYEQLDYQKSSSAAEDLEPELLKTKQLQQRCDALEKENITLKTKDQSELKMRVIQLE